MFITEKIYIYIFIPDHLAHSMFIFPRFSLLTLTFLGNLFLPVLWYHAKKSTAAVHTNCITVTLKLSMMYFPLTFMADWTGTLCYCRHLLAFLYLWTGKIHWESQSEQFIPLPMYKYYHPSCQCHVTIMIIT